MRQNSRRLVPIILLNLLVLATTSGQLVYELKFVGKLMDSQSKAIGNEAFDLSVRVTKEGNSSLLYDFTSPASSDDEGWITYTIGDISQFLFNERQFTVPLTIKMEIRANENTKWLGEGKYFMVTYTLKPDRNSNDEELKMNRLEGSTLVSHTEDHLFAFKDQDPFSYLLGGFLITDHPPISEESTQSLMQWLTPESQDLEGGATRGVKGGFPSGGYHRKK